MVLGNLINGHVENVGSGGLVDILTGGKCIEQTLVA